ncbi:hypothetical protein GC176_11215 [bacterium]|nr:hypothetical protein [bacterium]
MLKTSWKVCKWLFLILVLLTGALIGVGYHYLSQADELLHQELVSELRRLAPDATFQIGRCRLDWIGRVHVEEFSLTLPDEQQPFVDLPVTIVDIDREAFIHRQQILIQNVTVSRPYVEVTRYVDGTWNFEKLPLDALPKDGRSSLPSCHLEQARLVVHYKQPDGREPTTLVADSAEIQLTPNGRRNLLIEGTTELASVGRLAFEGRVDVDRRTGSLTGRLADLHVDQQLLKLASEFKPDLAEQVAAIEEKLRDRMLAEPDSENPLPVDIAGIGRTEQVPQSAIRVASSTDSTADVRLLNQSVDSLARRHRIPATWIGAENSILGLLADLDVSFRLNVPDPGAEPDVRLLVSVSGGEITNTALPFPLENLAGQIALNRQQVTIEKLSAVNGRTRIEVDGVLQPSDSGPFGQINLKLTDLACDDRLRRRLSAGFGRIYDMHHPSGFLNFAVTLAKSPGGKWQPQNLLVTAKKCSIAHDIFPYPIRDAQGSIRQQGHDLIINMQGLAGTRPITLKGYVKNPGPDSFSVFEVDVEDLPADSEFRSACNPRIQHVLDSLGIAGRIDVHARFEKQGGIEHKVKPRITGFVHHASMTYQKFPYQIEQLSGRIDFDGRDWTFNDLRGTHGSAKLEATGSFRRPGNEDILDLQIVTENAAIDDSLRQATRPVPSLAKLWSEISPAGRIRRLVTSLNWIPGRPLSVVIPEISLTDARMKLRCFPYEVTRIASELRYKDGWLLIDSFEGRHQETVLRTHPNPDSDGNGTARPFNYIRFDPNGEWLARFGRWSAEELYPDETLKASLGAGARGVMSSFDAQHPIDLYGMLELRGSRVNAHYPVTAAWEIETTVSGSTLLLGLELQDVRGRIISTGTWNGYEPNVRGTFDLASATIFDKYRLFEIRGPFAAKRNDAANEIQFVAGTSEALFATSGERVLDSSEQVTAKFIGGMLLMNAVASLNDRNAYSVRADLSHGQLKTFSQLYLKSRDRLEGVMNGWVRVDGQGADPDKMTGRGQLQINPAALYDLPVVLQVLSALTAAPQDAAAFEYARADFQIARQQFVFNRIDLVGQRLQLQGEGASDFDGRLGLTFFSVFPTATRSRGPWIPLLTEVAGLLTSVSNGVGVVVEVRGTTDNPQTRVIPAGNLDGSLRRVLESIKQLPTTPPPIPRFAPLTLQPLRRQPR